MNLPADVFRSDLAKSGLEPADMDAFVANETHLAAVGLSGSIQAALQGQQIAYVIPYFDVAGRRVPFYRLRVIDPNALDGRRGAKYRQPGGTGNFIYYPKSFTRNLEGALSGEGKSKINGFDPFLMVVEGEKKAARASKEGYLCVGIGGVYNWKSRQVVLPKDAKYEKDPKTGRTKVVFQGGDLEESSPEVIEDADDFDAFSGLAPGMLDLIELVRKHRLQVVLAFDADYPVNPKVQKACAALAFELRNKGIPLTHIRQLELPASVAQMKLGLDDYLEQYGSKELDNILHDLLARRTAFPRHPSIRQYVNTKLKRHNISRDTLRELAATIVADLDARGVRIKDADTGLPYYFDSDSKRLMPVQLMVHNAQPMHESGFGQFLYRNYDVSTGDTRLIPWIASTFTGEDPVDVARPKSIIEVRDNEICYQINDGQYVRVTADPRNPWEICDNGTNGILFRADQVEPFSAQIIAKEMERLSATHCRRPPNWWRPILRQFKFVRESDLDLVSLLFYMSPWLLRWRGTQLPFEMAIGEPGSGKSSLYTMRQRILTGYALLRNLPHDVRDWYASITSSGAMHVTDNVHFATKDLRQRLSDEICRIVTEPKPFVELRRLFTTSENLRIPVDCVFAVTAIQQPFINADILQRSVVFELEAVGGDHDSDWVGHSLMLHGGRAAWIAHHLWVLHNFLRTAVHEGKWNENYKSKHRLANFEQMVILMGGMMHLETDFLRGVIHSLNTQVEEQISEYDWGMQGLKAYAEEMRPHFEKNPKLTVTAADIVQWVLGKEDFYENQVLNAPRRLGRYLQSHKTTIQKITGLTEMGKSNNAKIYRVEPTQKS